jgi:hypothetical protein
MLNPELLRRQFRVHHAWYALAQAPQSVDEFYSLWIEIFNFAFCDVPKTMFKTTAARKHP